MTDRYNYLFIGLIIGIVLVLLIGWALREKPTISDCLRACEEEGWNRTEAWIKECGDACFKKYGAE